MTKKWAQEMAKDIDELIVITNGTDYKAVSPIVYEVAGYKKHGWTIEA